METCTGASSSCPTDKFRSSSTVCREVAGECDTAEFCSGSSSQCGTDIFLASGRSCNVSGCPLPSQCSGNASSCPVVACEGSTTVATNLTFPGNFSSVFQNTTLIQQLNDSLASDYKKQVGVDGTVTYMAEGSLIAVVVASIPKSQAALLEVVKAKTTTLATAPNWFPSVVATCDASRQGSSCGVQQPVVVTTIAVIPPPTPTKEKESSKLCSDGCIIGAVIGSVAAAIAVVVIAIMCVKQACSKDGGDSVVDGPKTNTQDEGNEPIDEGHESIEDVQTAEDADYSPVKL